MRKRWRHLFVLVPAIMVVGGCTTTARGPEAPLDLAARQVPADQMEALLAKAEADLRERRLESALNGFTSVLKASPDNARAQAGLAETHLAMGDGEMALRAFDGVAGPLAGQPHVLQGRGLAHLLVGNPAAAQPLLTRAVEADPSLWRAWNALALLADRQRNWAQADAAYQRAKEAAPAAAEVYNNHGYSLLQRGQHAAAVPLFQQALLLDPSLEPARNNLTLAGALQGRYEGALAAVPAENIPVALNNVGFAALLRGDYPAAETYLSRAVQSSPRHFERANENLRWLTYLREGAPAAPAPAAAAPSPPRQLVEPATVATRPAPIPPAPAAPTPVAQAPSPPAPVAATPVSLSRPAVREPVSGADGGARIALSAYSTEERARRDWEWLSKKHAAILAGREPIFTTITRPTDDRTLVHVRLAFGERAEAVRVCEELRARNQECQVLRPARSEQE